MTAVIPSVPTDPIQDTPETSTPPEVPLLPDDKPAWYQVLVGYRTVISILISSILKLLATQGIITEGGIKPDDVTDLVLLIASFVADGLSIWFKMRSPGPGKLASSDAVAKELLRRAEDEAKKLEEAINRSNELIKQAKLAAAAAEAAKKLKQGANK